MANMHPDPHNHPTLKRCILVPKWRRIQNVSDTVCSLHAFCCPLLPIKLSNVSSLLTQNFMPPYRHCEKYPLLVYKVSRQFYSSTIFVASYFRRTFP